MNYVILHGNKPLSGFHPNDLPVSYSGNGRFTPRLIFSFRQREHAVFGTAEEAKDYIKYIHSQLMDDNNRLRYESALPGSTVQLLSFAGKLKIANI